MLGWRSRPTLLGLGAVPQITWCGLVVGRCTTDHLVWSGGWALYHRSLVQVTSLVYVWDNLHSNVWSPQFNPVATIISIFLESDHHTLVKSIGHKYVSLFLRISLPCRTTLEDTSVISDNNSKWMLMESKRQFSSLGKHSGTF